MNTGSLTRREVLAWSGLAMTAMTGAASAERWEGRMEVRRTEAGQFEIVEGGKPVLRYNYATIEPGPILDRVTEPNRIYARPRSDYIHPLYGLEGEELTRDWPVDHPHHRGIYWAWPEVDFGKERGDLHALQRVFARPIGKCAGRTGKDWAEIDAENEWRWEDRTPIVHERARIRAYRATESGRILDLTFDFTGIAEGVTLARRETTHYGGLNIRLAPVAGQKIATVTDPPNAANRAAWSDLSGTFEGAKSPSGVTVFQSLRNPEYPGDWVQYPELNWLQPTFPTAGTRYSLPPGKRLTLRFRLWIHPGDNVSESEFRSRWQEFNRK